MLQATSKFGLILCLALFVFLPARSALAIDASQIGDLRLEIAASDDPSFIDEWTKTDSSHVVVVRRLRETKPGRTVHVAFIATGYTPDENGEVRLVVDWKLITPSGSTMFDDRNYASYFYKNPKSGFVMLDPALQVVLDESDLLGEYKLVGVLRDQVTGRVANHVIRFQLRK